MALVPTEPSSILQQPCDRTQLRRGCGRRLDVERENLAGFRNTGNTGDQSGADEKYGNHLIESIDVDEIVVNKPLELAIEGSLG
jgi:hypothetical protein